MSNTDSEEPRRAKLLMDIEAPSWAKSSTDSDLPQDAETTENPDPKRITLLRDSELPRCV
jgi:hypothetical protein